MLESYYEEVARKRNQRRVFWIVVLGFSAFLYLFFQGYYPYVRLDTWKFLEMGKPVANEKPQVVRAFGIINVRAVPDPDTITISSPSIGTKTVPNDDKGFFDFGNYSVEIRKEGYVPVSLATKLDKSNAFSISVVELFRKPTYSKSLVQADMAEDLGGGKILVREREEKGDAPSSLSGSIYRILNAKTFEIVASVRTDARHVGGRLFEKRGAFLSYEDSGLAPTALKTASGTLSIELCENATMDAEKIRCPKNGNVLIPHETSLRDRLLWNPGRAVHTETHTFRVEAGREISSAEIVTQSGTLAGNVVKIAKKPYRLFSGELLAFGSTSKNLDVSPLSWVASVHEFGNESIVLWYSGENAAFVLVDERGNRYPAIIGKVRTSDVRIEPFHGAYLVSEGKNLYLYYRGSKELTRLVEGRVLGFFENRVLFEKDSVTYVLELAVGE